MRICADTLNRARVQFARNTVAGDESARDVDGAGRIGARTRIETIVVARNRGRQCRRLIDFSPLHGRIVSIKSRRYTSWPQVGRQRHVELHLGLRAASGRAVIRSLSLAAAIVGGCARGPTIGADGCDGRAWLAGARSVAYARGIGELAARLAPLA